MPTLVELRHRRDDQDPDNDDADTDVEQDDEAKAQDVPSKEQETGKEQPHAKEDDDELAAKLAALDEEGM